MRERRAQTVLLVRAFEEADPEGRVLPALRRTEATRRALEIAEPALAEEGPAVIAQTRRAEAIQARADLLLDSLEERHPGLHRLLGAMRWSAGAALAACGAALAAGLASNVLGPARQVNLLAFPLIGLLGWNLLVYAWKIAGSGMARRAARRAASAAAPGGPLIRSAVRLVLRALPGRLRSGASPGDAAVFGRALAAFGQAWGRVAAPLLAARVRRTLHLAAIAAAAGTVAGMYLRGLAFEYRATWESTLLEARDVDALLGLLLGPASALLNLPVPDAEPLRSPGSGGAATWIHLYAFTTLLFVGLPRIALAALESLRAHRLASRLEVDLDAAYFRRILAPWSGAGLRLEVVPYSVRPAAGEREALKRLLHDVFGARSHVEIHAPVDYGAFPGAALDAGGMPSPEAGRSCIVVLFSLAQTPENDVHGAFLRGLTERLAGSPARLLVLVDRSRYRGRVQDPDRWNERFEIWKRVAGAVGLEPVGVDLGLPDGVVDKDDHRAGGTLDRITAALWSGEPH